MNKRLVINAALIASMKQQILGKRVRYPGMIILRSKGSAGFWKVQIFRVSMWNDP